MNLSVYVLIFSLYAFLNGVQDIKKTEVGMPVPQFTLADQNGNLLSVSSVIGKKYLVIYFYPEDDSPGCTKEAKKHVDEALRILKGLK